MTDGPTPIEIDPEDPILEHFAWQHDFRERYLHALEEILKVDMADPEAHIKMQLIAREATDPEKIAQWVADFRPLPWIDATVNPLAMRITDEVKNMLGLK